MRAPRTTFAAFVSLTLLAACSRSTTSSPPSTPPETTSATSTPSTTSTTPSSAIPSATATSTTSTTASSVRVTPRFCAFGGVGVAPNPLRRDPETTFASAVFELEQTGVPVSGVGVIDFVLLDKHGAIAASSKRVVELVDIGSATPALLPSAAGSWASYLNPAGTPFRGILGAGTTRLRVRVSLDRSPAEPATFRLKVGGFPTPIEVSGPVDGAWATG